MSKVLDQIIRVDEERLDREWVEQAEHVLTYTTSQADDRHSYDLAKARLELAEAELFLDICSDPTKYGFTGKPTVDATKACVIACPRYQKAQHEMLEAKHTLDISSAAVSALDGKKKALENMVQLKYMNYTSTPRPPKDPGGRESFRHDQEKSVLGNSIDRRDKK